MKRVKLTLGWSLLLLTGLSMLVTQVVILPFWVGDILTRETRHLHHLLAASLPALRAEPRTMPTGLQAVLAEMPGACVLWTGPNGSGHHGDSGCREEARSLVVAADTSGRAQNLHPSASLVDLLNSRFVFVALPIEPNAPNSGAIAVGVPLSRLLASLWHKEQVIAVYLLVNAVVLAVLTFFRLLRSYVRPIDRMVREAENYRSGDLDAFLTERPTNELGHLAGSIQDMVRRIEADKAALARTIDELAVKNTLLREKQQEMIRAEKLASVGRLAAGLAHEIGNPLGVAQGYLQLLEMGGCSDLERLEYSAKGLRELERVDGLLRRLLDYARSGQGRLEQFDAHYLLAEVGEDLQVQPLFRDIRIEADLVAEQCVLYADREQLRQVLVNCVLNAADAVKSAHKQEEGCIRLATTLSGSKENEQPMLRITITDNGIGIAEKILPVVFDPFFTTKEPGSGTGLGLSVSLAIVESMGGRMDIRSTEGKGTTVELLVPLAEQGQKTRPFCDLQGNDASC